MRRTPPQRDPVAAHLRKCVAQDRVGFGAVCHICGENRSEALIAGSDPMICAECKREADGRSTTDLHHIAGKANSSVTIRVPVDDHRAELSVMQYDWPKDTLENRGGSPFLAAAGCIRGFCDIVYYLIEKMLLWVADLLEAADVCLTQTLGPKYWLSKEFESVRKRQK